MRLVGVHDLQSRYAYQPVILQQGDRWIAYVGLRDGDAVNLMTGMSKPNGTMIVDVTNPRKAVTLSIPKKLPTTYPPPPRIRTGAVRHSVVRRVVRLRSRPTTLRWTTGGSFTSSAGPTPACTFWS